MTLDDLSLNELMTALKKEAEEAREYIKDIEYSSASARIHIDALEELVRKIDKRL